jgi:hypothetical protein
MALRQDSAAWVALYKEDMGCYFLTLRDTVVGQGSVFGVQIVIMFSAVRLQFFAPHFAFREASLCEEPNEVHNAKTGDAFWVAVSKTDFPSSDFFRQAGARWSLNMTVGAPCVSGFCAVCFSRAMASDMSRLLAGKADLTKTLLQELANSLRSVQQNRLLTAVVLNSINDARF